MLELNIMETRGQRSASFTNLDWLEEALVNLYDKYRFIK